MPTCDICHTFYVKPQTFETIFSRHNRCTLCETYAQVPLSHEVVPIDNNTIEVFAFNATEHPALTKRFFEWIYTHRPPCLLFYDQHLLITPLIVKLIGALGHPFTLLHYTKVPITLLDDGYDAFSQNQ